MIDLTYFSPWPGHVDKTGMVTPTSFSFINNDAENLVVTVGCSWTWGANMTPNDDISYRLENNFGRVLADKLSADWLCLGQVATGNFWLARKVEEFVKLVPTLHYKKIYIICTLTEVGRQCDTELDSHIDYKEYFKHNTYGNELLAFLNDSVVKQLIATVDPYNNITLRIGTNFVDPIGIDFARDYLIPDTWLSLLCKESGTAYTGPCYTVSHMAGDRLVQLARKYVTNSFGFKIWLDTILSSGITRIDLCQSCPLLMPDSGHPGAVGHKIWAEAILKTL